MYTLTISDKDELNYLSDAVGYAVSEGSSGLARIARMLDALRAHGFVYEPRGPMVDVLRHGARVGTIYTIAATKTNKARYRYNNASKTFAFESTNLEKVKMRAEHDYNSSIADLL